MPQDKSVFHDISLRRVRRNAHKPKFRADTPVNGFDTETTAGGVFLLSRAFHGQRGETLDCGGEILSPGEILEYLTNRNCRAAANVWYNMDFDANVIFSGFPKEFVYRLNITGQAEFDGWEITYLSRKLMSFRKNKNRIDHYDAAQFFFTSLDNAAAEWLGRRKEPGSLDVTKFSDPRYIRGHLEEIRHYARIDAELVRDLWIEFTTQAEAENIPCGRPYSTGYLGEQTLNYNFRNTEKQKPGFGFSQMQADAWASYRGGRFEVTSRGDVGPVALVDINSAYPYHLSELPDPSTLEWEFLQAPRLVDLLRRQPDYGIITARIWTDPERQIQPFAVKRNGLITFPALSGVRLSVTWATLEFAYRSGLLKKLEIERAWVGYQDERTLFPFAFLRDLYALRQRYKQAGRDKAQRVLKIIINSIYGKLCQVTVSKSLSRDEENPSFVNYANLPPDVVRWLQEEGLEIDAKMTAGSYFNPFLATHVTDLTRLQLLRTLDHFGLTPHVKMMATDSLGVSLRHFEASPLPGYLSKDLGAWGLECTGDAFIVGSGMYEIDTGDGLRTKTRGFERGLGGWSVELEGEGGLRALARRHSKSTEIPITTNRPLRIPQAITQGYSLEDVGSFLDFPRGINAGMDRKRKWIRSSPTWGELLDGEEISSPLHLRNPSHSLT